MGAGAVLIPGGNDTLLFKGLPGFSPHAAPALAAIFVGIGTGLLLVGWFADKKLIVDCREDRCRAYASFWKMKGGRSDQKVDNNR